MSPTARQRSPDPNRSQTEEGLSRSKDLPLFYLIYSISISIFRGPIPRLRFGEALLHQSCQKLKSEIVYNPTHSGEKPYFLKLYTIKYRLRNPLYFPMFLCLSVSDICSQYAAAQHRFLCLFFSQSQIPVPPLSRHSASDYFRFGICSLRL